jgi:hypothetical protein
MGHHKGGVDHFLRLSWDAELSQFGGIIFPGLDRFIGKENNLLSLLPEETDNPIRSRDE